MKRKTISIASITVCNLLLSTLLILQSCSKNPTSSDPAQSNWLPATDQVNGILAEVQGILILRLWGTYAEQGYANGYLTGPDYVTTLDGILSEHFLDITPDLYENTYLPALTRIAMLPEYREELDAMLAGIHARAGGRAVIPVLNRELTINDLIFFNNTGVMLFNCSSFSAWGAMTEGGSTIAGRNMDWNIFPPSIPFTQVITVRTPVDGSSGRGTVMIAFAGQIGCITGMNEDGITAATHDARGLPASHGITPYSHMLNFREALETASLQTAVQDIGQILRARPCIYSQNMHVALPALEAGIGSVVFELDGASYIESGVSTRQPDPSDVYQVCTNHHRVRQTPTDCWRYDTLNQTLEQIASSNGQTLLSVSDAWDLLKQVPIGSMLLFHSVVFEPDGKKMHVAFTENGQHAPECRIVTFDILDLLEENTP